MYNWTVRLQKEQVVEEMNHEIRNETECLEDLQEILQSREFCA